MTYAIEYMRYWKHSQRNGLYLAKKDNVGNIDSEDYNTNVFDLKGDGLQFAFTKLLSSDYFELFNLAMEGIKNTQWNYAIGMEEVGGWRRMVSEQKGPVSVDELKRLWSEVWCDVVGFHLGRDYRNYTGLEHIIRKEEEYS